MHAVQSLHWYCYNAPDEHMTWSATITMRHHTGRGSMDSDDKLFADTAASLPQRELCDQETCMHFTSDGTCKRGSRMCLALVCRPGTPAGLAGVLRPKSSMVHPERRSSCQTGRSSCLRLVHHVIYAQIGNLPKSISTSAHAVRDCSAFCIFKTYVLNIINTPSSNFGTACKATKKPVVVCTVLCGV